MLYIMRHGITDWNLKYRLQGRTDIPLNGQGREMCRQASEEYKNVHFDVCYCSPLIRARETAEILLKGRNIPIIADERLVEMCFGIYEGKERCLEIPDCPIKTLFLEPEKYTTPVGNAESLEQLFERTGEFIREVIQPQLEENRDILIVGHGALNSAIICQIKNLPVKNMWDFGIKNCKLLKLV